MSSLKVVHNFPKMDETGQVSGAYVLLTDPSNGDQFSADLVGDFRNASPDQLVEAVLDVVFKRYYADKVMLESVAKVDEALTGLTDYQKRQEEVNARIFAEIEALKRAQKGKAKPVEHSVEIEV